MIVNTTPGTHNPRISAQTVTNRLREIGERPPYTMYVLYAAFLFWPSIFDRFEIRVYGHLLGKGWSLGSLVVFLSLSHVVSWVRCGA